MTDDPRLKARLRVQALLRRAQAAGLMGAVLRRGDADAGALLLVLRAPEGLSLFAEARTSEGRAAWMRTGTDGPADQATVDGVIERQVRRDQDLWVIEVEAADVRRVVDEPVL